MRAAVGAWLVLCAVGRGSAQPPAAGVAAPAPDEDGSSQQGDDGSLQQEGVDRGNPRALFAAAKRAHRAGNYGRALSLLQQAHALDSSPELLYNIAQVQRKMGRCAEARESYLQYLNSELDPERRALALVGLERLKPCATRPAAPGQASDSAESTAQSPELPPAAVAPTEGDEPGAVATPGGSAILWLPWGVTGLLATGTALAAVTAFNIRADNRIPAAEPRSRARAEQLEQQGRRWALVADLLGAATLAMAGLSLYWTLDDDAATTTIGVQDSALMVRTRY